MQDPSASTGYSSLAVMICTSVVRYASVNQAIVQFRLPHRLRD